MSFHHKIRIWHIREEENDVHLPEFDFYTCIGARLTKFELALRYPPSHHLAYGSLLRFVPNFLYNRAMGSHIVSLDTSYCACGSTATSYTFQKYQ